MTLLDHAIDLAGFSGALTDDQVLERLKPGASATVIEWHGCMATDRHEASKGKVLKCEKRGRYAGVILLEDRGERWYPLDYVRFRGEQGLIEIWL